MLLDDGFLVRALVRDDSFCRLKPHKNLSVVRGNICDYKKLKNGVGEVDAVVHLAANKYHPKNSIIVATEGAKNLVRLTNEGKVRSKRIINISSQSTKVKWRGVYGTSKSKSDEIIMRSPGVKWTTLKPSLVYGNDQNTIFKTIANYALKLPFIPVIGDGKWVLFPIDVDDVAKMIIMAFKNDVTIGKVYDLGCEEGIQFNQLVELIKNELGVHKTIVNIPFGMGFLAVWIATKIVPNLPISIDNVLGSNQDTHCHPRKAIKDFKIIPLSVADGVKKYLGKANKLKVAIVGLGKMGILHATILATMNEVEIAAVVDIDKKLGKTAVSMGFGAKFYTSLKEAVRNNKIGAVFICTPNFNHLEMVEECKKLNLPFMVEKPVTTNIVDWKKLLFGMSEKVKIRSMAGYFWIKKREIIFIKNLLKKKIIGEVLSYSIVLKHGEVFGKKKGWMFIKKLSGGGVLMNPGPHAFSIIRYLFGIGKIDQSRLKYVFGNEVEDEAKIILSHGKIKGELLASWSVKNEPVLKIELEINGILGSISFKNGKLTVKEKIIEYEEIPGNRDVFNLNPKSGGDAYYMEDKEFVESCIFGKAPEASLYFARDVEEMIFSSYKNDRK
jgi:NADH dehydrogenase